MSSTTMSLIDATAIFDSFLSARRARHGDLRMELGESEGGGTEGQGEGGEDGEQQPKPTDTVDYWKQRSRDNEKQAKANADAAKRLAEIEESQKTEAQKTADRLAAAEKDAADARSEALRLRVAAKHGISDDDADLFLTGTDEATLTKQAERLAGREADRKKQGNRVPREGTTSTQTANDERAFVRGLFGGAT